MRRRPWGAAALLLAGLGAVASPAAAQEDIDPVVRGIERRTTDIVRTIESISGDIQTAETPEQVQVTLAADVLFEFDQAALTAGAAAKIDEVAGQLNDGGTGTVTIVGHTDSVGEDAYNQDLSLRRATAVRDALSPKAPDFTFEVSGKGESEPVAPNTNEDGSDNPAGRASNRRVTITFDKA